MAFTAFLDGLMISFSLYFLKFHPRKSKPSSMLVTTVFSSDSSKTSLREKLPDDFFGFKSQLRGCCCDDEIICIAHKVHLVGILESNIHFAERVLCGIARPAAFPSHPASCSPEWGNDAALRSAFLCGKEFALVDEPCFQELFQDALIHWDICQQPIMADVVKTALDVTLQNPFRRDVFA